MAETTNYNTGGKKGGTIYHTRTPKSLRLVDLPASSDLHGIEIDCSGNNVIGVELSVNAAFDFVFAKDQIEADAEFAATSPKRIFRHFSGGYRYIAVSSDERNLYIRSNGAAVVEGLSYSIVEQD